MQLFPLQLRRMAEVNENKAPCKPSIVPDDFYWDEDFGRWCKIIGEINGDPIYRVFNLSAKKCAELFQQSIVSLPD
jgi:hypothetical protein